MMLMLVFSASSPLSFMFFSSPLNSDEAIFICLLTHFYTLLFLHWSAFPHVVYMVHFSYVIELCSLCSLFSFSSLEPYFVKLQVCISLMTVAEFIAVGPPVPSLYPISCHSLPVLLCIHPASPHLKPPVIVPGLYFSTLHHY